MFLPSLQSSTRFSPFYHYSAGLAWKHLAATTTNAMGIHPVFGAFMMGVILPRRTAFVEQVKNIDQVNYILFLPLYFVYNGLRTHIGLINSPALWIICILVLILACFSKILGGSLSLKVFGSSWKESLTLGTLMNTRGLVELIVLNIGLDLGIITPTFFTMLVIMAIVTTMMAPPLLSLFGYKQKNLKKQESKDTRGFLKSKSVGLNEQACS